MIRPLLLAVALLATQSPAWAALFPLNVVSETDWESPGGRSQELLRDRDLGIVTFFKEPDFFRETEVLKLLDSYISNPETEHGRVTYIGIYTKSAINTRAVSRRLKKLDAMGILVIFIVKQGLFC